MRPQFELNHLKYFYLTVLEGGVGAAADRMNVQQPVVSKMLRSLEETFQQPLFRKSGRRKVLTDFGQLVYRHCQTAFREIEHLESIQSGTRIAVGGPLNFGCADAVISSSLEETVIAMSDEFPNLHFNVYTSTATHLLDLIAGRKLEFGLFFHAPALPRPLEVIQRLPIRFRVVVAAREKSNAKVIGRFIGSREIDDTSTHRFPTVERLRQRYPDVRIALSSNHLGFHKRMALKGFGSAVLPDTMVRDEIRKGMLHDLYPREKTTFDLKVVAPKAEALSLSAEQFLSRIVTALAN